MVFCALAEFITCNHIKKYQQALKAVFFSFALPRHAAMSWNISNGGEEHGT
jgi:hypothetical protein